MDQETLFTASKWEILKLLSEQPLSPIELAAKSHTSVANISQQLRLLEMAGLVKSERVPNRDKGQPRILYSLVGDQSFLIAATNDFVEKKLLRLSAYNKAILRIWFYDDPDTRYILEKAFWRIEPRLKDIRQLGIHSTDRKRVRFCVFSDTVTSIPDFTTTNLSGDDVTVSFEIKKWGCDEKAHVLYSDEAHA